MKKFILLSLFACLVASLIFWLSPKVPPMGDIPASLQLKATADKILDYKEEHEFVCTSPKNCVDKGLVARYVYVSSEEVPTEKNEELDKRQPNVRVFKDGNNTISHFYLAKPFYFDKVTSKWFYVNVATTTPDAFLQQITYSNVLRNFIGTAWADDLYSGAGDGRIGNGTGADWAARHDASAGDDAAYTAGTDYVIYVGGWDPGSAGYIYRGFFPIDTSSLPDGDTITAADLKLYVTTMDNNYTGSVYIVQTSQADTSQLVVGDYDQVGSTSGGTNTLANLTTGAYRTISMNSTGIGWISKTGVTQIGIREGYDFNNTNPQMAGTDQFQCRMSEYGSNQPYLAVTHSAGATNTCTYSGTGDWNVLQSDNCYMNANVYVNGAFNLIGSSTAGMFGCASGVKVSATEFNFGTAKTKFDIKCFAHH